jgi:hypothetical protein
MKRKRVPCAVPGCPHYGLPRVNQTAIGPLVDTEVICREHWHALPIGRRRIYRRARKMFFSNPEGYHKLVQWLWRRLRNDAIERAVGI